VAVALEARNRTSGGPTAPPDGLTLIKVGYSADPFGPAILSAVTPNGSQGLIDAARTASKMPID
jgi:hypothetical protein